MNYVFSTIVYYIIIHRMANSMRCCFLNCHSLNGDKRPASIVDLILENSIQCLCLCQTWLNVDDQKNRAVLNQGLPDGYSILHVPRPARGGGVGFIFSDQYKVTLDNSIKCSSSFECMSVLVQSVSYFLWFIILSRPPPSTKNKILKTSFIEDFGKLLELASTIRPRARYRNPPPPWGLLQTYISENHGP